MLSRPAVMDSTLQDAWFLCTCKLTCSLLFLPSLRSCCSPVAFCCCCLLLLTDFLFTVFLSWFRIQDLWFSVGTPHGENVSVHFLLFLCRLYAGVLLIATPLIAVETLVPHLWPSSRRRDDEEEEDTEKKKGCSTSSVSYLSCLVVWVLAAFNVQHRWGLEVHLARSCLRSRRSLLGCLPTLLHPLPGVVTPWSMAVLSLLLLLVASVQILSQRSLHKRWQVFSTRGTSSVDRESWKQMSESVVFEEEEATKRRTPEMVAEPSGRWGFPCCGVKVIIGYLLVFSLCTLPLNLSVNIFLFRSLETVLQLLVSFVERPQNTGALV